MFNFILQSAKKKNQPTLDYEKSVELFLEKCCKIDSNQECYTRSLYDAYVAFLRKTYAFEAMKSTRFQNKLLVLLKDRIKKIRPRHAREDNRRGFRGISVDSDKLSKYIADKTEQSEHTRVFDRLNDIHQEVIKLLRTKNSN